MADFGGFEIETPQEVLARVKQRQAKAMQSRDPLLRVMARNRAAFTALFGNDEVLEAEKKVNRVGKAMAKATDSLPDGASDIQRRKARLEAAQSELELTDPAQAAKIEQQLLQLDSEQFERDRLLAKDRRDQESHELLQAQREARIKQLEQDMAMDEAVAGMRVAVWGPADKPNLRSFNLGTEEGQAKARQFMQENPDALLVEPDQVFRNIYDQDESGSSVGKVEGRKLRTRANSQINTLNFANRYLEVLRNNPDTFSLATQGSSFLDNAARQLQSAASNAREIALNHGFHTENQKRINDALAEAGITNARMQGLTINLAYTFARSLDPGGRLSDQDVDRAIQMVGGKNVSAEALAQTLRDAVGISARNVLSELTRSPDSAAQFGNHIAALDEGLRSFNELSQSFIERDNPPPDPADVADDNDNPGNRRGGTKTTSGAVKTSSGALVGGDY